MKKSLLIISAFIVSTLGAKAQITITSADIASPLKLIQQAHDTMPTISIGSAGISQVWNMAALNTHTMDSLDFIYANWAPKFSQFPTSTAAVHFTGNDAYAYVVNTSSSFTILGQSIVMDFGGGPSDIVIKITPAQILCNFPATYLTTFNNNFTTNGTFFFGSSGIDSIRQKSVVTGTSTVDAWGNLTTPLGTYASLRFYEIKQQVDTTWFYIPALGGWQTSGAFAPQASADSSKNYSWWANGVGFPLVDVSVDYVTGAVNSVDWLKATPTAGINEYTNAENVNVYPNPAQNHISFEVETSKIATIQIIDIAGHIIDSYSVSGGIATINTSNFANGSYTYALIGKDNAILNRGKFTIAK